MNHPQCIEHLPFAVFELDSNLKIIECNSHGEAITGYVKTELIQQTVSLIFQDNTPLSFLSFPKNNKANTCDEIQDIPVVLKQKNQSYMHVNVRFTHHEDTCFIYIFSNSVLENVKHPTQFNYSTTEAHQALNGIDEAFWEWQVNKGVVHYSPALMSLLGRKKEDYFDSTFFGLSHFAFKNKNNIKKQFLDLLRGNISLVNSTYEVCSYQGQKKWFNVVGKVFEFKNGKPSRIFGSVKEVTETYLLMDKLNQQHNYSLLAEKLGNSGYWRFDLNTQNLFWSRGIYYIHGLDEADYKPSLNTAINFYVEEEQKKVKRKLERAIANKSSFYLKSKIISKRGKEVKVESLGQVELDEYGDVIAIFGVFRDISRSEALFEKLLLLSLVNYTIKVPVFFINEQDNVVYQDLTPKQFSANSPALFSYINFSLTDYLDFKRKVKKEGQLKRTRISFDEFNSVFDLSVTYVPEQQVYIWIVENVTEKFRKEQQQVISNRLALLGNTFGSVSHDINNVLGVALGATEMLELKFSKGAQDISKYIDRVKNAIDKGKSVTERLLAFTRTPSVKVIQFDPIAEINANKSLFEQLLLSTISFKLNIDKAQCEIVFPQAEFINMLLNIVLNAQDAIREKNLIGCIEVSANISQGKYLEIHIHDSGVGIDEDKISKIFDPFYSSKSVNKGNGIGLANVYNTLYKYNGKILVQGKGKLGGAHFTLIFNCKVSDKPEYLLANKEINKNVSFAYKNILILDDETSIAEFVAMFLESEGANTCFVDNKAKLINALNSNEHFDLFLTDMVLPDISGSEAVNLVLKKIPNIKVLSMSGYIAEKESDWKYPILRKPFNSKDLVNFLTEHSV